jgi:Na+/phosphate symporter
MFDFIREAGFGIYPVMIFGAGALLMAALELREGLGRRVGAAGWLMGVTLLSGLLGTITGMKVSADHIHEVDKKWIFLVGLGESLSNLVASTVLVIVAMLLLFAANLRRGGEAARARGAVPAAQRDDHGMSARVA